MMKKILPILIVIISAISVFAGAFLLKFDVRSENGNVILEWQTSSETNLKHYVVERKSVSGGFVDIATIEPRADKTYKYIDQSAYKSNDVIYSYRVRIVDNDGSVSHTDERAVRHDVSSVKRTWGSIKAIFLNR